MITQIVLGAAIIMLMLILAYPLSGALRHFGVPIIP